MLRSFKSLKWNARLRDCFPALGGKFTLCGAFSKLNRQELMSFCFWMEGKCWLATASFFCWRFTFVQWGEISHVEIYSNLLIAHKWICPKHVIWGYTMVMWLMASIRGCIYIYRYGFFFNRHKIVELFYSLAAHLKVTEYLLESRIFVKCKWVFLNFSLASRIVIIWTGNHGR